MSDSHSSEPWLERNWYWLLILFGIIFIGCIDLFGTVGGVANPREKSPKVSTLHPISHPLRLNS